MSEFHTAQAKSGNIYHQEAKTFAKFALVTTLTVGNLKYMVVKKTKMLLLYPSKMAPGCQATPVMSVGGSILCVRIWKVISFPPEILEYPQ